MERSFAASTDMVAVSRESDFRFSALADVKLNGKQSAGGSALSTRSALILNIERLAPHTPSPGL